jgi:DNA-nicking Smr family endonuclease
MKKTQPSKSSGPSSSSSSKTGSRPDPPGERSFAEFAGEINGLHPLDSPPRTQHPADRGKPPPRPSAPSPDNPDTPGHGTPTPKSHAESSSSSNPGRTTARILRKLRAGKLRPESTIDLHGLNRSEALSRLSNEIMRSTSQAHRCVLVIHGRGYGSPDGLPVLKQALTQWLGESPLKELVHSSAPARPRDGGAGATYLLLRR